MRRFPPPKVLSRVYRILAYGNSFTAGVSGTKLFPYSVYLEPALQAAAFLGHDDVGVRVDHRGNPGWTTQGMLNTLDGKHVGLRSAIVKAVNEAAAPRKVKGAALVLGTNEIIAPYSLVILMAGSNDLGRSTATAESIGSNLIKLHQVCLDNGVPRTIAVGIPPSGHQADNVALAEKAATVNTNLERHFAKDNGLKRTTYVPFPFAFVRRSRNWYPDDLHLTEAGYQVLAKSLVPVVIDVLHSLDEETNEQTIGSEF